MILDVCVSPRNLVIVVTNRVVLHRCCVCFIYVLRPAMAVSRWALDDHVDDVCDSLIQSSVTIVSLVPTPDRSLPTI